MSRISKVRKRDGRIADFDRNRIINAVRKASCEAGVKQDIGEKITNNVEKILFEKYKGKIPTVENIQDIVEDILIKKGYSKAAKAYILYRNKRKELRSSKSYFGVKDDLKLSLNAVKVLQRRYLLRDENGRIIETPAELFRRVAHAIAKVDRIYGDDSDAAEEEYFNLMKNLEFIPNSPCLMNAGTKVQMLSACFVIPVEDSLDKIFDALKIAGMIQKYSGGTGFSFSKLRPKGSVVGTTKGAASGPVSFMGLFDKMTDVIKAGGKRRGANMGILRADHPDILDFINCKLDSNAFNNFNISIAATDKFMDAVIRNKDYEIIDPITKKVIKKLNARNVFDLIAVNAWRTGDPGLVFIDTINRMHNLNEEIESTNPCGEQPLLPYESCVLGSINLGRFVFEGKINWDKLKKTICTAVRFLDNVIDANEYVIKEIEDVTKANRRIGLGVMGWADMLILLGISYNSNSALKLAEKLMKFINNEARNASEYLGIKRGDFPNFKNSKLFGKYKHSRNVAVTTIAPTGTISIIANCSSGIEPLFAISYIREVMEGTKLVETNPLFEETSKRRGFYDEGLFNEISRLGSVQIIKEIPSDVKKLFVTALDIKSEWHVKMQAAFQKYVENGVSKTVNLPETATKDDVKNIYLSAYKLKCKGITVFRYNSKGKQVLYIEDNYLKLDSEFSGGCLTIECGN